MITYSILFIMFMALDSILNLLPEPNPLSANIDLGIDTILSYFVKLNAILPVSEILTILTLIISIEGGILTFKLFNFVYNKIRGAG